MAEAAMAHPSLDQRRTKGRVDRERVMDSARLACAQWTDSNATALLGRKGDAEGVSALELRGALLVEDVHFGDREACCL
jgi:hypothetical protein